MSSSQRDSKALARFVKALRASLEGQFDTAPKLATSTYAAATPAEKRPGANLTRAIWLVTLRASVVRRLATPALTHAHDALARGDRSAGEAAQALLLQKHPAFEPLRVDALHEAYGACRTLLVDPSHDGLFRNPHLLGLIYERWMRQERAELYRQVLAQSARKIRGREVAETTRLYTPPVIGRYLAASAFAAHQPEKRSDTLKVLDPACGSGDLLLTALETWAEGSREEPKVLLAGLDLDALGVALTSVSLAMRADELGIEEGRVAIVTDCFDTHLAPTAVSPKSAPSAAALETYFEELSDAHLLGSLILPPTLSADSENPAQAHWVSRDEPRSPPLTGLGLLSERFDIVLANPPFLSNRQMGDRLRNFLKKRYPDTAVDLYASFLDRIISFTASGGGFAVVCPQGWTTLTSFSRFRRRLLESCTLTSLISLGQGVFADAALLYVGLLAGRHAPPPSNHAVATLRLDPHHLDHLSRPELFEAATRLPQQLARALPRAILPVHAPAKILSLVMKATTRLGDRATVVAGIDTGDNRRFVRLRWEVHRVPAGRFLPYSKGKGFLRWSGQSDSDVVVDWADGGALLRSHPGSTIRNARFHLKPGLECSYVYGGKVSCRRLAPSIPDHGSLGVFTKTARDEGFILALLNSHLGSYLGRLLSPTLNLQVGCLEVFPLPDLDLESPHRQSIDELVANAEACVALSRARESLLEPFDRRGPWSDDARRAPSDAVDRWITVAALEAATLILEAENERLLREVYELDLETQKALEAETGTPAAAYPLREGSRDAIPCPDSLPELRPSFERAAHALSSLPVEGTSSWNPHEVARHLMTAYCDEKGGARRRQKHQRQPESERGKPLPPTSALESLARDAGGRRENPLTLYWLFRTAARSNAAISDTARRAQLIELASAAVISVTIESEEGFLELSAEGFSTIANRMEQFGAQTNAAGLFQQVMKEHLESWIESRFMALHVERYRKTPIIWHIRWPLPVNGPRFSFFVDGSRAGEALLARLAERARALLESTPSDRHRRALEACIDALLSTLATGFRPSEKQEPGAESSSTTELDRYRPRPEQGLLVALAPLQRAGLLAIELLSPEEIEKKIRARAI